MRWLVEYWLLVYLVTATADNHFNAVDDNKQIHKLNSTQYNRSIQLVDSFTSGYPNAQFSDGQRVKRAATVIDGPTGARLIDEKQCPEIRNLCNNLHENNDDLSVLECVQTFLNNQIESISDECHHTIWMHTKNIMSDAAVLQLVEKPCQTIIGNNYLYYLFPFNLQELPFGYNLLSNAPEQSFVYS